MGACLFCKIAAGDVAALVVDEGPDTIAFLDHRPVFPGHCLVVTEAALRDAARRATADARARSSPTCSASRARWRRGSAPTAPSWRRNNRVSQSVPHVHVHVVPRRKKDGLKGFFWPRQKYESDDAARAIRDAIRNALT